MNRQSENILRIPDVLARVGLSRSTIYARISEGTFPAPINLGSDGRAVGFLESEIDAWIAQQIDRSRSVAK